MANKLNTGIPEPIGLLLDDEDKFHNRPVGTMRSVFLQEVGGNIQKYLENPEEYHYPLNSEGKRIAGHTGKVSTAFGPFGILESTAADPGYGVVPLKDKGIAEQIRFASDYLQARIKQAGSLEAGLAGYGEGSKYAQQVLARLEGKDTEGKNPAGKNDKGVRTAAYKPQGAKQGQGIPSMPVEPQANTEPVEILDPPQGNDVQAWAEFLDALKSNMTTPREHDPAGQPETVRPQVMNNGGINPMDMLVALMSEADTRRPPDVFNGGFESMQGWGV